MKKILVKKALAKIEKDRNSEKEAAKLILNLGDAVDLDLLKKIQKGGFTTSLILINDFCVSSYRKDIFSRFLVID